MIAINKWLHISESHGHSNRCTPCRGKPDQHARMLPTLVHIRPAYASSGWSPYMATFHRMLIDLDRSYCSRHNPQHAGWLIHGSVPSFSPELANEVGGISQAPHGDQLVGLPSSYHRHAIGMFNNCSRGPTERSLTDPGRGYNLGGAGLTHTHSSTFPTSYPHFPLKAPPGLYFNHVLTTKPKCWVLKNLWPPRGLSITRPSTVAYIYT
jgi:hypothetical protein